MTYNPQWVDNSVLDPTKFGNWVLLKEIIGDGATAIDEDIDLTGYTRLRIEALKSNGDTLTFRFNDDSGSNYITSNILQNGNAVSSATSTATEFNIGPSAPENVYTIVEGALTGETSKNLFRRQSRYDTADADFNLLISSFIYNSSSDITKCTILSAGSTFDGNIKVFAWQEVQPVELHSLELVAEYNFSAESIDETITWDGEQDDYIRIELNGDFDSLEMQINNDTGSNYAGYSIAQNGATPAAGGSTSQTGITLTTSSGRDQFSILEGNLKNLGGRRCFHTTVAKYVSSDTDNIYSAVGGYWTNNSDDVTSITIIDGSSGAGSSTGNVKVYRRAKTSILSTAPDALHGLEQASADSTGQVTVGAGSVEIKGKTLHLQSPTTINVYDNLRSGDSISGGEYVYLYAYDSNNSVGLEYSTSSPTKDRYGNTLIFEDVIFSTGLYHPSDPTRRYIGQVYIDSGLQMVEFDKCYPGYWESKWTTISTGLQTLNHGLGVIPRAQFNMLFSDDSGATSIPHIDYYFDGSNGFGVGARRSITNSTITLFFSSTNVYQDGSGTWQTTGDFKLIVKAQ